MPTILGTLLKNTITLSSKLKREKRPFRQQQETLIKLLTKAKDTAFGHQYHFDQILKSANVVRSFQENVPTYDYNKIYKE